MTSYNVGFPWFLIRGFLLNCSVQKLWRITYKYGMMMSYIHACHIHARMRTIIIAHIHIYINVSVYHISFPLKFSHINLSGGCISLDERLSVLDSGLASAAGVKSPACVSVFGQLSLLLDGVSIGPANSGMVGEVSHPIPICELLWSAWWCHIHPLSNLIFDIWLPSFHWVKIGITYNYVTGSGKTQHVAKSIKIEILLYLTSIKPELQVC